MERISEETDFSKSKAVQRVSGVEGTLKKTQIKPTA
jgi:hypothetical protein